jgi:nicotinamidase-related amidase
MSGYRMRTIACLVTLLLTCGLSVADDIVSSWASVKVPPPPPLKTVTVDPSQTALLLLDFSKATCNMENRPRCAETLPNVTRLLNEARSHHISVVYSTVMNGSIEDSPEALAARPDEPIVSSGADKFLNTDLESILKAKNIHTVIVAGTIAPGAVLYTASTAALHGFAVVVPVDAMSANDPFSELSTTWVLAHAAVSVSSHITLTRSDMISY